MFKKFVISSFLLQTRIGLLLPDAIVVFEKAKDTGVNLVGQSKGYVFLLFISYIS